MNVKPKQNCARPKKYSFLMNLLKSRQMTKYFDVRWRMEYSYDVYKKSQKFSNENRTKYTIFPTEAPDMT